MWQRIILYWLFWPVIGGIVALSITVYLLAGWEDFKQTDPVHFPVPYEAWSLP